MINYDNVMLNLLFLGQNWVKIKISTLGHTYDTFLTTHGQDTQYEMYLLHKERFVFNVWRFSAKPSPYSSFFNFQSISTLSIHGCK